jgi:hypothetical protein
VWFSNAITRIFTTLLPSPFLPPSSVQVVSTHYEVGRSFGGQKNTVLQYQMVVNSQVGRKGRRGGREAGAESSQKSGNGLQSILTFPSLPPSPSPRR